jgi:hypothetical protein
VNQFKKPKPLFTITNPVHLKSLKIYWSTVSKNQCDIWYPHFSSNNHHHCRIVLPLILDTAATESSFSLSIETVVAAVVYFCHFRSSIPSFRFGHRISSTDASKSILLYYFLTRYSFYFCFKYLSCMIFLLFDHCVVSTCNFV